jgi:hypothetical protein
MLGAIGTVGGMVVGAVAAASLGRRRRSAGQEELLDSAAGRLEHGLELFAARMAGLRLQ